jgi:hypothetical protein
MEMGKRKFTKASLVSADKKAGTTQLIFPNRENVVTQQLQNALSVMATSGSILANASRGAGGGATPSEEFPAEGKIALENTLVAACDRLDKILSDDSRWDLAIQVKLEKDFQEMRTQNLNALRMAEWADLARKRVADEMLTPHAKYRPSITRLQGGGFVAFVGNLNEPDSLIAGLGASPQEAVEAFDMVFKLGLTPEMTATLKKVDTELYGNAKTSVDSGRGKDIQGTEIEGDAAPSDSEETKPQPVIRSKQVGEGFFRRLFRRFRFRRD